MKNISKKTNPTLPKQPRSEVVVSERGNWEPPARGGESNMPDRHYEHKQHAFDSYCKRLIKNEARSAFRQLQERQEWETVFSELPEETMEQLASWDRYPWEWTSFPLEDDVILIENVRLADALSALSPESRDILLMYWFLELTDREIGERVHLPRRTVNYRRLQAYRLLKKLMGGEVG